MTAVLRRALARSELVDAARGLLAQGYRCVLVAGSQPAVDLQVVYAFARPVSAGPEPIVELLVDVPVDDAWVPTLAELSYPIGRFERQLHDLFGITAREHPLPFRLVRHAHWPHTWHPMRHEAGPVPAFAPDVSAYPFLEVDGHGVYEIPVGPVHAGLIEPGHFRFSVVGETIIRMKARLWFVHRGVERLFEGRRPQDGLELAERISGDTAVGHSLAFAMACEQALALTVSEPERVLRAILLELERMYNHVGDLGALLNDVAFGLAQSHAQRIREDLLRLNASVTGHRLLRGAIGIGSTRVLALPDLAVVRTCAQRTAKLVELALDHRMVLDRLSGTAVLSRQDADRVGVLGYVARASGLPGDARADHPFVALGPGFEPVVETGGDVLARFLVRARELATSAELVSQLCERLDGFTGPDQVENHDREGAAAAAGGRAGLALVEAWRGTASHRVELAPDGTLARVAVVDPSFFTWPALPIALADTIVADFPLVNKSFNQSYAGNDL